ncbi:NADPH-dependent FMN reductase [Photobacterium frigidiphilum]|uniref:NADPH-dependent FMN reductase n=1 Tax=Photobacterium frigidiphilum TaxID=264736 RepID=A0A2T3JRE1_9GAMM|nr:NADPH-dependent FMN reductase [Photobacterium frigidiphilum]PSU51625.1 NADPH-dependent FMN reductase [Photobacterium frigidiphilum]
MKKILAFSGSNHSQSIHSVLINTLAAKAISTQVTTINLMDFELPMYGIDVESNGIPETLIKLKKIMSEYDALIIASPEHNGSMPVFLKNVIDWLSRIAEPGQSFFGSNKTPILLVSASPGENGGATNLKIMAELMPWWGADVKGTYSLGHYHDKLMNGSFDIPTQGRLTTLMADFENSLGEK